MAVRMVYIHTDAEYSASMICAKLPLCVDVSPMRTHWSAEQNEKSRLGDVQSRIADMSTRNCAAGLLPIH